MMKLSCFFQASLKISVCLFFLLSNMSCSRCLIKANEPIKKYRHGFVREYYGNGKLWYEGEFINNAPVGLERIYYEEGPLKEFWDYDSHKVFQFYPTGELQGVGQLTENNEPTVWKTFYKTGELEWVWNYKGKVRNGISKQYYPTGELMAEFNYSEDKPMGVGKSYYRNGQVEKEWNFDKNSLTFFSEDGKVISTEPIEKR